MGGPGAIARRWRVSSGSRTVAVPSRAATSRPSSTPPGRLDHVTLDLVLVPANDGGRYLRILHERASRVRADPVPRPRHPDELPAALNPYDIGVYCLPPANVNMEYALPDKLFDFVQARLGWWSARRRRWAASCVSTTSGRSPQASTWTPSRGARGAHPESVRAAKESAHCRARELSSDSDSAVADGIVTRLLEGRDQVARPGSTEGPIRSRPWGRSTTRGDP